MIGAAILATILVSGSAGGGAATATSTSGAGVVLEFADHLLDAGEPYRAAGEYERYLFLCPSCDRSAYAERKLADAWRRGGRAREAAARYRALVTAHPESPEAPLAAAAAAESFEDAGAPGEASDAYRAYLSQFPHERGAAEAWTRSLRTALRANDATRVRAALEAPSPDGAQTVDEAGLLADLDRRPSRRSPALAGTMSAVLPGAGHFYAGRYRDGVMAFVVNALFIGGAVIAYDHDQYALAGALAGAEIFWYGGSVVGAVNAADRHNRRAESLKYKSIERKWVPAAALSLRF